MLQMVVTTMIMIIIISKSMNVVELFPLLPLVMEGLDFALFRNGSSRYVKISVKHFTQCKNPMDWLNMYNFDWRHDLFPNREGVWHVLSVVNLGFTDNKNQTS